MMYISLFMTTMLHFVLFGRRSLTDPISVFFICYLYYSYFTPVTMLLFDQFDLLLLERVNWISMDTINRSSILSFIGYAGYSIGYFFLTRKVNFQQTDNNRSIILLFSDTYTKILVSFILVISSSIVIFYSNELIYATSSYESKISGNYLGSGYAFLISIVITLLSLLTNYFILNGRNFQLISFIGLFLFINIAILTYSKGPFIYAALCGFCFLHRYGRVPTWISLVGMATAAVLALVYFVPAFAAYRATGEFDLLASDAVTLNTIFSDASGPYGVINFALNGYVSMDDHPLWESFILWVPRALWADRPLDVAEGFARQVMENWQPGYGVGFSPLAEGYARYGIWGSGLFMALMGATFASIQRAFAFFLPAAMRVPVMLTIGGYVSVLVLRGPFSGLITQSIQNWLPVILIGLVARELTRRLDSRQKIEPSVQPA